MLFAYVLLIFITVPLLSALCHFITLYNIGFLFMKNYQQIFELEQENLIVTQGRTLEEYARIVVLMA